MYGVVPRHAAGPEDTPLTLMGLSVPREGTLIQSYFVEGGGDGGDGAGEADPVCPEL